MLVLVTGATGLVGAHTVAAITAKGLRVRVLARDPVAVERALTPLGVSSDAIEVALGDITDPVAVGRAMRSTDALVHAAGVYSFDTRRRVDTRRANVRGTEVVLAAARRSTATRIIHVSTFGAMLPTPDGVVTLQSPPGSARETYLASKAAAEAIARDHQRDGAPVCITYPPALLGPNDPKLGDQNSRLRNVLRGLMPVWPSGGFPIGDVRDTATMHASLIDAPMGGFDRHFGPGHNLSTRTYVNAIRAVTGRPLPTLFLPARLMLPFAAVTGLAQRVWPWHIPAEYGACYVCACDARPEGPAPLGLTPRPLAETLGDTIRWLAATGRLSARQCGHAADADTRRPDPQ